MTFDVTNWNIEENRDWYVRLEDAGSDMTVGLYYTQSDAQHDNNRIAQATGVSFGTDVEVTVTAETGYTIEYFQTEYDWHLKVTGENGDSGKVYKISQFTDIDGISHSIFRNTNLIAIKAQDEVDKHTHARIVRDLPLGTHIPDVKMGDVITVNSSRRNVNELNQIIEHTITGVIQQADVRLISEITTIKFLEMAK